MMLPLCGNITKNRLCDTIQTNGPTIWDLTVYRVFPLPIGKGSGSDPLGKICIIFLVNLGKVCVVFGPILETKIAFSKFNKELLNFWYLK